MGKIPTTKLTARRSLRESRNTNRTAERKAKKCWRWEDFTFLAPNATNPAESIINYEDVQDDKEIQVKADFTYLSKMT